VGLRRTLRQWVILDKWPTQSWTVQMVDVSFCGIRANRTLTAFGPFMSNSRYRRDMRRLPSGTLVSASPEYFREIAEAWQGFDGVREYASLEGQLQLACRHDGKGIVECRVALRHPAPEGWSFEAALEIGAGAHADRIAAGVEGFVASTE
jgi:hypothetical protein